VVELSFLFAEVSITYGLFLILSLSFNLEYGYAGQPNLGKVFFYSVGAYVAGGLTTRALWAIAGFPADEELLLGNAGAAMRTAFARDNPGVIMGLFLVSLLLGTVAGAAFGYLASYPVLRLRGDFLAITMIAIGEVSRVFVLNYAPIAGGEFNLPGVPNPFVWLRDSRVSDSVYALVVLGFAGCAYLFSVRLLNSPFGRLLKSLRDDELAASAFGKRTPRVKAHVIAIGSAMAALAGVLQVFYRGTVSAGNYIPLVTFTVVTMVIVGGAANNLGVAVGVLFITLVDLFTRRSFLLIIGITANPPFDINYLRYMIIGLLIVVALMFRPQGLLPEKPVATPALTATDGRPTSPTEAAPGSPGGDA
jgi:branched-chain amino acid transport system permease protein